MKKTADNGQSAVLPAETTPSTYYCIRLGRDFGGRLASWPFSTVFFARVLFIFFLFVFCFSRISYAATQKLVILSPHWEGMRQEFTWAFKKWYEERTGDRVEVEWLDQGGTSECLRFIFSQFVRRPDGIGVDLFFGGGTDPYLELKNRGLLAAYPQAKETLRRIPAELNGVPLYDPQYFWFGTHLSTFGILTNKWVSARQGLPSPKSWEDLADPRLRGWVGSGDPRASGAMHMMYELVLQSRGWEEGLRLLTPLCGNVRRFTRHGSQAAKEVAMGEVACALAIDSYAWSQIDQTGKEKLTFIIPKGETLVNADAIGILRGAPHLAVAQKFVDFALSPVGQRLSMLPPGTPGGPREYALYKMCIDPQIYREESSRVYFNPFIEENAAGFRYDFEKGSQRWDLVNRLLAALYIDPHGKLKKAWKQVAARGVTPEKLKRLGGAPLGEEEAMALAQKEWKDPIERERLARQWAAFARRKYDSILKERR